MTKIELRTIIHQESGQPRRNRKVLRNYNLPRVNQEEIENLNKPITAKKTESVI